jgi:hypothetical protein
MNHFDTATATDLHRIVAAFVVNTTEHVVRAELHDAMHALRRILRDVHVAV